MTGMKDGFMRRALYVALAAAVLLFIVSMAPERSSRRESFKGIPPNVKPAALERAMKAALDRGWKLRDSEPIHVRLDARTGTHLRRASFSPRQDYSQSGFSLWDWDDGNPDTWEATIVMDASEGGGNFVADVQIGGAELLGDAEIIWNYVADVEAYEWPYNGYEIGWSNRVAPPRSPRFQASVVPCRFNLSRTLRLHPVRFQGCSWCCRTQWQVANALASQPVEDVGQYLSQNFGPAVRQAASVTAVASVVMREKNWKTIVTTFVMETAENLIGIFGAVKPIDLKR